MRFTRIKSSFSEHRRIPRLGRIRLGLKVAVLNPDGKPKLSTSGAPIFRPKETDHFVVPKEVAEIVGEKPHTLDIMLPSENPETIFPQSLAWFGTSKGLKCTGNMETAERLSDNGEWVKRSCPCEHYRSESNPKGECTENGTLIFMLPKVSMGGTYEVRTGSYHSVVDINSGLDFIRSLIGRISMVPLKLRRVARETHNEGKKQIHYTLSVILDANVEGVNQLRNDTSRILSTAMLEIDGPTEVNPLLDPADISEVDAAEDEGGIDAEQLADMDESQLADVQNKLREQTKKAEPAKPADPKPNNPLPQQTPGASTPSGQAAAGGTPVKSEAPKEQTAKNGTHAHALIPKEEWESIVYEIDAALALVEIKKRWKAANNVSNIMLLKAVGQHALLHYMREEATKAGVKITF